MMTTVNLSLSFLKSVPRERDVISMHFGADSRGTYCLFKFRLKKGSDDVVIAPTTVAFHIRSAFRHAVTKLKYKDVRRRGSNPKPELPVIRAFLDNQPDIEPGDWDGQDRSRIAVGCEVRAFSDAVFLGFNVGDGTIYKVLRLAPPLSFYIVDTLAMMEREGALKDLLSSVNGQKH